MKTLPIGHAVAVRYRDAPFEDMLAGLRRSVSITQPLVMSFWGLPPLLLAAEVREMARRLERPLLRVDLAGIASRYIGETEKNLDRVFQQAQASGAVLLFDEADALFGPRTEVRSAHDRYAGLDINFLLQRMERHRGLIVLTSTSPTLPDRIKRRLRAVAVRFPPG